MKMGFAVQRLGRETGRSYLYLQGRASLFAVPVLILLAERPSGAQFAIGEHDI